MHNSDDSKASGGTGSTGARLQRSLALKMTPPPRVFTAEGTSGTGASQRMRARPGLAAAFVRRPWPRRRGSRPLFLWAAGSRKGERCRGWV